MSLEEKLVAKRAMMDQIEAHLHEGLDELEADEVAYRGVFRILHEDPEKLRRAPPEVLRLVAQLACHMFVSKALSDLEAEQLAEG